MTDYMTFDEALQDPSLSHYHEIIHFLEENEDTILFPTKYMMGLKHCVEQSIRELYNKNPKMPILLVVIESLSGMYDKLPPEMILEITAHIMKEWESLTIVAKKENELHPV